MAKKREIFKVNEDVLKDMMASESISCGKSGGDIGGNVVLLQKREKCAGSRETGTGKVPQNDTC